MPRNPYYSGPPSDHFDGLRFFNPGHPPTDRSLADIWRWQRRRNREPWPDSVPITPARPDARVDALRITMVGHATLLIQFAGLNILTDPVWSDRASPVGFAGPRRVTKPGIAFEDLPAIDVVLISHNHYDHLDLATLRKLAHHHKPRIIAPLGTDTLVRHAVPDGDIRTGDWHDTLSVAELSITLTPANHWSSRGIRDRRMALWCGFLIRAGAHRVWFAGDTGYGDGRIFRDFQTRYGPADVALIPIGAYEPRWFMADQHVNPAEAVAIFRDVGAERAIGMHWGTFRLTDESRDAPRLQLANALAENGIAPHRFVAAEAGDVFDLTGTTAGTTGPATSATSTKGHGFGET